MPLSWETPVLLEQTPAAASPQTEERRSRLPRLPPTAPTTDVAPTPRKRAVSTLVTQPPAAQYEPQYQLLQRKVPRQNQVGAPRLHPPPAPPRLLSTKRDGPLRIGRIAADALSRPVRVVGVPMLRSTLSLSEQRQLLPGDPRVAAGALPPRNLPQAKEAWTIARESVPSVSLPLYAGRHKLRQCAMLGNVRGSPTRLVCDGCPRNELLHRECSIVLDWHAASSRGDQVKIEADPIYVSLQREWQRLGLEPQSKHPEHLAWPTPDRMCCTCSTLRRCERAEVARSIQCLALLEPLRKRHELASVHLLLPMTITSGSLTAQTAEGMRFVRQGDERVRYSVWLLNSSFSLIGVRRHPARASNPPFKSRPHRQTGMALLHTGKS